MKHLKYLFVLALIVSAVAVAGEGGAATLM